MFSFFGDTSYLLLLVIIFIIFIVINRNSWSPEVLSKDPNALTKNNSLIILDLFLIGIIFIKYSWIAGITALVLIFILYVILAGMISREIEKEIFKPKNIVNNLNTNKRPFLSLHFFGITLNKLATVVLGLIGMLFFGGLINAFGVIFFILGIVAYIVDYKNSRKVLKK